MKAAPYLLFAVNVGLLAVGLRTKVWAAEMEASVRAQVPGWSAEDLEFFLHGSMSAEIVPERMLQAFIRTYPDLFPTADLSHLGLIPDPAFGWPLGLSRKSVARFGGLPSVGINCASCHVSEIVPAHGGGAAIRVLGNASHFDVEAFYGSLLAAGFRTADPAAMRRFLAAYLAVSDRTGNGVPDLLAEAWKRQEPKLLAALSAGAPAPADESSGGLLPVDGTELKLDRAMIERGADLAPCVQALLKVFHNMRAAIHFPDQPPAAAPPASGPGRNDAFGLLSAELLGRVRPYAPVKFGMVWNLDQRPWVHWDGDTRSPIARNLLAALGLGAPMLGRHGDLDFVQLERHTTLTEKIRPPRFPFAIDLDAARRGAVGYAAQCASCHDGPETDGRLHALAEVGTDPRRLESVGPEQAAAFNAFLANLETEGYQPPAEPGVRDTQKYFAASLGGVWARAPYLHNGSVRTMQQLLTAPASRESKWRRGSKRYDAGALGYSDEGPYVFDAATPGNSAAGHDYGTGLSASEKRDLIEYLKTL